MRNGLGRPGRYFSPAPTPWGLLEAASARARPQTERGQIVDDGVPYRFDIHPVIAMPEPVADAADIVPRQAGAQTLRILSEPHRRLADEQKLALDRGNRLRVFPGTHPNPCHARTGRSCQPRRGYSRRERVGSLKGK